MKKYIPLFIIAISFAFNAHASSSPFHYIWAKSGLNVRVAPGTHQKIIEKAPFGDSLTLLSYTGVSYNVTGIQNIDSTQYYTSRPERKAPFILYGEWVEVYTSSGKIGFVINQYLLPLRPYENEWIRLKEISNDTIINDIHGFDARYLHKKYEGGISSDMYINEKYYDETFIFPNMSIQDVFVILTVDMSYQKRLIVRKNWSKSLRYSDGEMCEFNIEQMDGFVRLIWSCSC